MSDAVGYRKLAVNGRYIRGFGVPKYASKATSAPSGGGEAPTPGKDEKPTPGLAVGSVVTFTGTKHYISSMAVNGKSCKPGEAKVTAVAKSGKHPYHLIKTTGSSSTVYGWVDAADVKEVVPAIVKGSRVKVANLALLTAYVLYAKDVFVKLKNLILSKTSGTPPEELAAEQETAE